MKTKRRFSAPRRKYRQTGHPTHVKRIAAYKEFLKKCKKRRKGTPTIKQVLPPEKEKRGTDDLFVLLFTRLALQGIVCYTYKSVLSGGKYK